MNRFDLRPRTVGEVLDAAIRMWLANLRTLIPLVACVVVPLEIVSGVLVATLTPHGDQISTSVFDLHLHFVRERNGTVRNVGPRYSEGPLWSDLGISTLMGLLSTAACVRALADVASGASPSIAASLAAAVRRLPALIALFILRTLGLIIGVILLIVPGVWVAGSWSVSVPALVLEGARPVRALRRSTWLVAGRWWPVVGVVIVADLIIGLIPTVVQTLANGLDGFSSHPGVVTASIIVTVGGTIASLLVQPFNAAVRVVLYLDLRIRQGGEELEALAEQLGVEAPPAPPAPPGSPGPPGPRGTPNPAPRRGPHDPPYWPPPPGWTPPDDDDRA